MKCGGCQASLAVTGKAIPVIFAERGLFVDCPNCGFRTRVPIEDFINYDYDIIADKVAEKLSVAIKLMNKEFK